MHSEIDVDTATVDALVAFCSRASCETLGERSGIVYGGRIVKVSEQAVIKFGIGVTESEANNQRGAYQLLDPSIVRVPRVYRFFSQGRNGWDYHSFTRQTRDLGHFTRVLRDHVKELISKNNPGVIVRSSKREAPKTE